ncbi:hypothetical protein [Breoghania sp. L-A4]|uniref:hypothetical protein n=1 Tax=Breoghania sp. L-A4 TaxID=2304600 RepID=UPI0013C362C2|nr:hypothetical protein [Breoghania sp. L-A4]
MAVIAQEVINQARHLNSIGNYVEAYRALGRAGDNYAFAAANIIDDINDVYQGTVKRLWETVRPGSVEKYWSSVAGQHQLNCIRSIPIKLDRLARKRQYAPGKDLRSDAAALVKGPHDDACRRLRARRIRQSINAAANL